MVFVELDIVVTNVNGDHRQEVILPHFAAFDARTPIFDVSSRKGFWKQI